MISHRWDGNICKRCGAQPAADGSDAEENCVPYTPVIGRLLRGLLELWAYDTETHLIQPGLAAPPLVCGSAADKTPGSERILSKDDARQFFRWLLKKPDVVIGGANLVYDFGVHAADEQRQVEGGEISAPPPGESIVELIFQLLEEGRAVSTNILEALHDNARGQMYFDPQHGTTGYALDFLERRYLGVDRSEEKKNGWRLKYALLDGMSLDQWPEDAIGYPRRDARGTLDVLLHQLGLVGEKQHAWQEGADEWTMICALCGARTGSGTDPGECPNGKPAPRLNLQCNTIEMRAAWFLCLSAIWGMRTDPVMVPVVVERITKKHEESRRKFFDVGIVRVRPVTKKKDTKTGESKYEETDDISIAWLDEAAQRVLALTTDNEWVQRRLGDIRTARKVLEKGEKGIRFAEDKGRLKELVERAYQGNPPLTDGGESGNRQTSTSRDTLSESGDVTLEEYGEAGPNEKLYVAFKKVLLQGTVMPINPSPNPLVTSQRTSYRDPNLQQLPRKGGIRECFVPRGYFDDETEAA